MGVSIAESFELPVAPDRVWAYLTDPRQVVQCLPGAELLEVEDERTFVGRMRVKVGPVTAGFRGRARFDELDATARRVRLSGEGQEQSGGGAAKMTMTSEITPLPGGGSRVRVEADIEVVGRLVQFGRGMMEEVSRQMFKQFAACMQAALPPDPPVTESSATTSAAEPQKQPEPPPRQETQPLRVLPLLWAAFKAWIAKLFGR